MIRSKFVQVPQECVPGVMYTIKDVGKDTNVSVTNDAENVVKYLYEHGIIQEHIRLFYYDSLNDLSELLHENGEFTGFA